MRINEIFYSLQGEGRWAGTPCVFVRFSGCNLMCDFCDTKHEEYTKMTEVEMLNFITECDKGSNRVVLTGGEPALQLTEEFIEMLHAVGYYVAVETNGTRPLPPGIDWITCSPKSEFCDNAKVILDDSNFIDEIKVIYRGKHEDMSAYDSLSAMNYYLQPCDVGDPAENRRIMQEAIEYIKSNPKWKLSLQTQKILGIR